MLPIRRRMMAARSSRPWRTTTKRFAFTNSQKLTQGYLTAQRPVDFPPKGRFVFYVLALALGGFSASSVARLYDIREPFDEALRKAQAGEAIFGTQKTIQSMEALVDLINEVENLHDSLDDFPNLIPRLFRNGGAQAMLKGLQSPNEKLTSATVELMCVASRRPEAAKILMNMVNLSTIVFKKAADAAVHGRKCPTCSMPESPLVLQSLEFLASGIPHYPFAKVPEMDVSVARLLGEVSNAAARYAQQVAEAEDALQQPLLLEPPILPPRIISPDNSLHHARTHDFTWHVRAIDLLLNICVNAIMNQPSAMAIVDPALPGLSKLYEAGLMTDEQALYFGLLCMEVLPLKQTGDLFKHREPGFDKAVEEYAQSKLVSHHRYRKIVKGFLDHAEFLTRAAFAASLGYIWGVTRTLYALRNVVPISPPPAPPTVPEPNFGVKSGTPFILGSRRVQLVEPRAWRWMMSRRHGGLAALGALTAISSDALFTGPLGWNWYIASENMQITAEIAKAIANIGLISLLLHRTPFFLLPAVAATTLTSASHDDSVQFTIEWWPSPKPPPPSDGGGGGSQGGKWT